MLNLAIHGVTIIMSRVLLDVNFNDQTTDNHALNSDWKESPTLNIAMSNYEFVELESGDYCLHNLGTGAVIITEVIRMLVQNSET